MQLWGYSRVAEACVCGGGGYSGMNGIMGQQGGGPNGSGGDGNVPYEMTAVGGLQRVAINVGHLMEGMVGVNGATVERFLRPFQGIADLGQRCAESVGRTLLAVAPEVDVVARHARAVDPRR